MARIMWYYLHSNPYSLTYPSNGNNISVHEADAGQRRARSGGRCRSHAAVRSGQKLWVYIKKHNLQDPTNKRNINADAALTKVFGGKTVVNMFEMTKLVSKHLS